MVSCPGTLSRSTVPAGPAVTETARGPGGEPVPPALRVAAIVAIRATTTRPAPARITVARRGAQPGRGLGQLFGVTCSFLPAGRYSMPYRTANTAPFGIRAGHGGQLR